MPFSSRVTLVFWLALDLVSGWLAVTHMPFDCHCHTAMLISLQTVMSTINCKLTLLWFLIVL